MIGKRIGGRYEILKYIGGGGMSKVYLSNDVILDRNVAIKVLNYDFSNEEELKRRFMREAISATSLTHPHIVNIFDVGEEGELHYLVMEYVEGQTLKEYIIVNGPLEPEKAVPIMRQLVSAISNAHFNGIIHRDIKPQNILMDADGNLKITDFGIAMALSATAHTKTNSVIGTVHYLSPEQARGGMATKKSDIYSLGIVLYELLTGRLPFSGESAVAIALKHLQEETPSVRKVFPDIPQSVENVILKATAKDAKYRYASADEMQEDLSTVLSSERLHEPKFTIPMDDELTRSIPAVVEPNKFEQLAYTKKIEPIQEPAEPVEQKRRKKWPWIVGISAGALVLLLIALLLPGMLGPKRAEIPNVVGLDEAAAEDLLKEYGFIVGERKPQPSDEYEEGIVLQTIPEAEKKRDVGTEVILYISTGKESMELDDYVGGDFTQVASLLAVYDFKDIREDPVYDEASPGTILEQNPVAGSIIVPSETELVFKVSKGKDLRELEDLEGYSEFELTQYVRISGFDISVVEEHHETIPKGYVISQKPAPHTELEKGGKVEVVVSKGPEEKGPNKIIIQTVTILYKPQEMPPDDDDDPDGEPEKVPQKIRIFIQDINHNMTEPVHEFSITEDTVKKIQLELEEGQSGKFRIERDSMVILEESVHYDYKE